MNVYAQNNTESKATKARPVEMQGGGGRQWRGTDQASQL